jgi:hypothetical protein
MGPFFHNGFSLMEGARKKDENLERRNLVNCEGVKKTCVKVLEEGGTWF